jgi:DNA-binding response OmpR family regulator
VPSKKTLVLVVDDDIRILRMIRRMLELEGYSVITSGDGQSALEVFDGEAPDLVLLDVMMPDMDGKTVCQRIREFSQVPIIMVTAKGEDDDKVKGLDSGADDYVTKPFSAGELAARVRAVLRRSTVAEEPFDLTFQSGDLVVDFVRQRALIAGEVIDLTATEYKVLAYLAHNADRIVTPNQVLEAVWGDGYLNETNLLQANIARLRKKLGDDARNPRYIFTHPGMGYRLAKHAEL